MVPKKVEHVSYEKAAIIQEAAGSLARDPDEDKLMHSLLENDTKSIEDAQLINDAINQGLGSFTPNLLFEQIVKDYRNARTCYGDRLIRLLTGYDERYLQKNINLPEFRRELKQQIEEHITKLKQRKLLNRDGMLTDKALRFGAVALSMEELNHLLAKGFLGEKIHKKHAIYGDKENLKPFKKGHRYRDIAIKKSVQRAVRRQHHALMKEDLVAHERQQKGKISIIYALDASGSMRGKKIETCKRAGIALAYKAIEAKDQIGLLVFGSDIVAEVKPTQDFALLLEKIAGIRASQQTDLAKTISHAIQLFPSVDQTKHLILLTDAKPTVGKNPEEKTLETVALARQAGITISVIGIDIDEKGKRMAQKMVEIGEGRFYVLTNLSELDMIVLQDYAQVA
ncbi:VWA domain-containing protein [Candidatus Woesearchaeota archaeon]|nr:VWA domain-containing protein [Candidatus Woesearchaeota archaeon]